MSVVEDFHKYYDEVYSQDYGGKNPKEPHGWIQWKGTNVCMDIHCPCGTRGHVDAEFFYHYKCSGCGKVYAVGQNVKLIELTEEQIAHNSREGTTPPLMDAREQVTENSFMSRVEPADWKVG